MRMALHILQRLRLQCLLDQDFGEGSARSLHNTPISEADGDSAGGMPASPDPRIGSLFRLSFPRGFDVQPVD